MRLEDFFDSVAAHKDLEGVGVDRDEQRVIVKFKPMGLLTSLSCASIENSDWDTLEQLLLCKREPMVLRHVSRVVGYYSRIENWNKSKLGELKARHKGEYVIQERTPES